MEEKQEVTNQVYVGTCKWFSTKGEAFGYIKYELGEIYCHYKNVGTAGLRPSDWKNGKWFKTMRPNDILEFSIAEGFGINKGTQAVNVEIKKQAKDANSC